MRMKSKEEFDLTGQDVDVYDAESVAKAGSPSRVP